MEPNTKLPKTPAIKELFALITQTSTNAPTLKTLKNTYNGTITKTRIDEGKYKLTFTDNQLINDKTNFSITNNWSTLNNYSIYKLSNNDNEIYIETATLEITEGTLSATNHDEMLQDTPIWITTKQ